MKNLEPQRAKWMRLRLGILVCLLGVGFTRLVGAAWDLQVRRAPALREEAEQQYTRRLEFSPRRGTIYDTNMKALAMSADVDNVFISPAEIKRNKEDPALIAQGPAEQLNLTTRCGCRNI